MSRPYRIPLNDPVGLQGVVTRFGLTPRAIRHYEQVGLIQLDRDRNNHRRYDRGVLERLEIIVAFRHLGLSLREISTYLALLDDDDQPGHVVYATDRLTERLRRLDTQRRAIAQLLETRTLPGSRTMKTFSLAADRPLRIDSQFAQRGASDADGAAISLGRRSVEC